MGLGRGHMRQGECLNPNRLAAYRAQISLAHFTELRQTAQQAKREQAERERRRVE